MYIATTTIVARSTMLETRWRSDIWVTVTVFTLLSVIRPAGSRTEFSREIVLGLPVYDRWTCHWASVSSSDVIR